MVHIFLALFLAVTLSIPASAERFISNARVKQIIRQETERCPRCTSKELLIRINKRIANETH